jgi:hypothetical protein
VRNAGTVEPVADERAGEHAGSTGGRRFGAREFFDGFDRSSRMATDPTTTLSERLADAFWSRHANPWSAGTRFLTMPALAYAIYRRDRRLLLVVVGFAVLNPVAFPAPDRTDTWLSRIVLAEREWLRDGKGTMGFTYPNLLNVLNVPASLLVVWAAWKRRPMVTLVACLIAMGLKLWWVDAIARRTEAGRTGVWEE